MDMINVPTPPPLMACGHTANAHQPTPWAGPGTSRPICVVCWPSESSTELDADRPDETYLFGREARCYCGATTPSSHSLAFFEYRGVGSLDATRTCRRCHFYDEAHTRKLRGDPVPSLVCDDFEPDPEGREFDVYYCGHAGWD